MPLIERCCDELSAPDRLHRIDRLELDLGPVDPDRLEADLVAKVGAILRRRLAEEIGGQESAAVPPDKTPKAHSQLELFSLFARQGSLPWWADLAQPHLLEDSLDYLLRHAPDRLRRLLSELAREDRPLQRLIRHYDDQRLAALAALHTAELGDFPAALFQSLMVARERARLLAGMPSSEFRRKLWQIILHVAALSDTPHRDPPTFCRSVLMRLAAKCGIPYTVLLQDLGEALPGGDSDADRKIREIIERLAGDAAPPDSSSPDQNRLSLDSVWPKTLQTRRMGRAERQRSETHHPPDHAKTMGFAALRSALPILQQLDEAEPIDLSFSDADEVYIDTAGLVLLWPFLDRFFERLGLITENHFQDAAAVQRAVGLLHYLATEETDPPEYRLPLAKVLCGMEPEAVFLLEPPLSAEEMSECALLLERRDRTRADPAQYVHHRLPRHFPAPSGHTRPA